MTNRYFSVESTAAAFDSDTHTFGANRHDIDVISEELNFNKGHIYPSTSTGRTRRGRIKGPKSWTGTMEAPFFPVEVASLVYYSLGACATVVDMPTTGINTHTINHATSIPKFIMEVGRDDKAHKYTGCVATGCTVDYAPDATLTASVDIFARKEQATGTLASITFEDFDVANRAFGGVEVIPKMGTANGTPSAVTYVESASVTWENEFADDAFALGSEFLPANIVQDFTATGSFDVRFTLASDVYDFVSASTNRSFELNATYGSGTAQRDVTLKLDNISFDNTTIPTDGNKRYVQSVEFTCENNTAGLPMKIDIVNAHSNAVFTA